MKKLRAFTLLELMIAVVIIAILVGIAVPTYLTFVKKSRRNDAVQALLSMQLAQEKYRLNNNSYGDLSQIWGGATTTAGGYYTLAISGTSATGYTLTATATGTQVGDTEDGSSCDTLILTNLNGVVTKTPTACWSDS